MRPDSLVVSLAAYTLLWPGAGHAAEMAPKCVLKGTVAHVRDGDTISIAITEWPKGCPPIVVRVANLDTPESLERYASKKCAKKEVRLGVIAKARAKQMLPEGSQVTVNSDGELDLYNRLLGDIITADGKNFGAEQIRSGMAREYHGERKGDYWCK